MQITLIFLVRCEKNMKARIPVAKTLNQKQKDELNAYIQQRGIEIYREEAQGLFRRYFKLMAVALNKKYGFGSKRIMAIFDEFTELSKERGNDIIFWRHVDKIIKDELNLPFEREKYDELE